MIFPGNFLSGVVYFPVISPPAVFISLQFSLTTAAAVSSYYIILGMCSFQHKWASERQLYLFVLLARSLAFLFPNRELQFHLHLC